MWIIFIFLWGWFGNRLGTVTVYFARLDKGWHLCGKEYLILFATEFARFFSVAIPPRSVTREPWVVYYFYTKNPFLYEVNYFSGELTVDMIIKCVFNTAMHVVTYSSFSIFLKNNWGVTVQLVNFRSCCKYLRRPGIPQTL